VKILQIFNSKQIRTAAVGSVAIKFLSALFALANGILLANFMSVAAFGVYVLAFTTITVISIPVSMGLPHLITRFTSKYVVSNDMAALKGLLIRSNQFVLLSTLIAVVLALISYVLWWKTYSSEIVATFWYAFLLLPLLVFGALRAATLRGLKYVILGQMPDTFLRNLFFTMLLLSVFLFDLEMTPKRAMIFHSIAAAMAFFIGYLFLRLKLLKDLRGVKAVFFSRSWLKEAIPFSVISGVQVVKSKVLVYILVVFGNTEAVAIFDVAMRGAALVSFTVDALNKAISPYISSAFERKHMDSLQRIVKKTARIILVFSMPIALVFIFGGKPILSLLFGENYATSYLPLLVLCLGHLVNTLVGPVAPVLNMTGNQGFLSKNQILMMIISVVLSVPFVYYWDVLGAAFVFSIVITLQGFLLVVFIKRKLHINTTVF